MKLDTRYIVASLVTMAALSHVSAQQPATREFQPLTVVVSTTPQVTGRSTWDRLLRSISRDFQDRVEHSSVLRLESLQKSTVRGAPHDSAAVVVRYNVAIEPTTNANGDPAMPPTVEWYIVGPLNCPAPPKFHGTVPMSPPDGGSGDAAPVVAALITTLESIAKNDERCHG